MTIKGWVNELKGTASRDVAHNTQIPSKKGYGLGQETFLSGIIFQVFLQYNQHIAKKEFRIKTI